MKIPANVVDNRPEPFPVGVYIGELADVEQRDAADGETVFVRLNFINNTPADDNTDEVGSRIHREDLCIRFRGDSLFDHDEVTRETPFLLRRAAGHLASFALAIGAVERGEGGSVDFDLNQFTHDLLEGEYTGEKVLFQIEHNEWKRKDAGENDPVNIDAQVRRFATAV